MTGPALRRPASRARDRGRAGLVALLAVTALAASTACGRTDDASPPTSGTAGTTTGTPAPGTTPGISGTTPGTPGTPATVDGSGTTQPTDGPTYLPTTSVPPSSAATTVAPSTTPTTPVRTTVPTTPRPTTTTTTPAGPALRVTRGSSSRPIVALTFDAGSDTGNAARILDILAAAHVRASFGMTATWAEQNPDLFRRMVSEGHQIINHTADHRSWTGRSTSTAPLTEAERLDELRRAEATFTRLAGATVRPWFRPPYGDTDAGVDALLGRAGYRYDVLWSVDSRGWKGDSPEQIVATVRAALAPGAIVLMHVGAASRDADALPGIIEAVAAAGLSAGAVDAVVP